MTRDPSKRLPLKFDETNPIQNPTTTKSSNFTRFLALHKTILMNGIRSIPLFSSPLLHPMCKTTHKEIGRIFLKCMWRASYTC
jgi:hypothetical protein